jgi:hypothetical protein
MPPMTCAMTIWLDQFLIGILIGALLSALAAPDTEIRITDKAANKVVKNVDLVTVMMSFLFRERGERSGLLLIVKSRPGKPGYVATVFAVLIAPGGAADAACQGSGAFSLIQVDDRY